MAEDPLQPLDEIFEHNKEFYQDNLTSYNTNRVRILGINPGSFNDPLICRLRTLPLRQDLAYSALSYAWGSQPGYESININGQADFKVTVGVAAALRRLRHPDRTRCLWVDAICINQANIKERSGQVALMAFIFEYAEVVYVWLGPCDVTKEHTRENEHCYEHSIMWDGTFEFATALEAPLCNVHASGKLQWWWRTWAVQEIALARKVVVVAGSHRLSWQKALEAFEKSWLKSRWARGSQGERYHMAYQQLLQFNTVRAKRAWICNHLRYLLQLTSSHAASDPKDKVYGVLGLLGTRSDAHRIWPDYAKSYEEICKDATIHLIHSEQSLDILVEDWQRLPKPASSWALDFSKAFRKPPSLLQREEVSYLEPPSSVRNTLKCRASKETKPVFEYDGQSLLVQGLEFDTIVAVVRINPESLGKFAVEPQALMDKLHFNHPSTPKHLRESNEVDRKSWLALLDLERLAKLVKPGALNGTDQDLSPADQEAQFAQTVTTDSQPPTKQTGQIRMRDFKQHSAAFDLFCESAWSTQRGRTFFLTQRGFCGVGAPETQVSDVVVVPYGASIPFVLRPTEPAGAYYLVGECYVAGIMYGEFMEGVQSSGKAREFTLL